MNHFQTEFIFIFEDSFLETFLSLPRQWKWAEWPRNSFQTQIYVGEAEDDRVSPKTDS